MCINISKILGVSLCAGRKISGIGYIFSFYCGKKRKGRYGRFCV